MKINKIKINSYGKLKEKEINFKDGINLIYGQNEAGKSTLIKFITNSLYGISKNKKGKEVSDFDKYKPWSGEEFSGKLEYELDNKEKYEIYRDFSKKNPKIFNENMEDISKEFNIDKNKGNEFFYEQTKIDEDLFLSTLAINQSEVKLENQAQNFLIQKIANLAQTGDDSISFKRVMDRINRRQLDEVGTERSREKPINIVARKLQELNAEKENLEKFKNFKYEYEEQENDLNDEILNLENENNFLKEIKLQKENEKIENEKIKIKKNIENENLEKINSVNKKINELKINNKNILEKYLNNNLENNLKEMFKQNKSKEMIVGSTLIGPQKDDILFLLDNKELKKFGSQGQQRMAVIALKMASIEILRRYDKVTPILLLDDVFSELDFEKRNSLFEYIYDNVQTFITTTDLSNLNEELVKLARIFNVDNGNIVAIGEVIRDGK